MTTNEAPICVCPECHFRLPCVCTPKKAATASLPSGEYSGLVERLEEHGKTLREQEAADAIKAQAKRIEELERENSKLRSALEIVHFKREPWQ